MSITITDLNEKNLSLLLSNTVDEESIELDDSYDFEDEPYFYKDTEACVMKGMASEDIDNLQISRLSCFKDDIWSLDINSDDVQKIQSTFYFSDLTSNHLKRFVKSWAYFKLPESSGLKLRTFVTTLGHIKAIGKYLYELGFFKESPIEISYKGLDCFTLSDRDNLFDRIKMDAVSSQFKKGTAIQDYFKRLIVGGFLPREYCFPFDLFDSKSSYTVFPCPEHNSWEPLASEVLYPIAQTALSVINNLSDDIIYCFHTLEKSAKQRDLTDKSRYFHVERITKILKDHQYACWPDGSPWHTNTFKKKYEHISIAFIRSKGARLLRSACEILLSLCLGLRISELATLKSGCCKKVNEPRNTDVSEFEITVTIFKTVKEKKGKEVTLPCPQLVYTCVQVLENLFKYSNRNKQDVNFLLKSLWNRDSKYDSKSNHSVHTQSITGNLRFFADWCDVDLFHHHQFRKTIAQFLVHRNPKNLDLVKLLFSHASLSMSLKYIIHIPTIARDIRNQIIHENIDIFSEMLASASKGTIGGNKREHIIASTQEENPLFKGETQYELGRNLLSYIELLMRNGSTILRRTPMNICIAEESPLEPLPCRIESADLNKRNKPNVSNCKGYECANAVFTEKDEPEIRNDIKWYENKILNNVHAHEKQKKDAQQQLSKLYKILADITNPVTRDVTA